MMKHQKFNKIETHEQFSYLYNNVRHNIEQPNDKIIKIRSLNKQDSFHIHDYDKKVMQKLKQQQSEPLNLSSEDQLMDNLQKNNQLNKQLQELYQQNYQSNFVKRWHPFTFQQKSYMLQKQNFNLQDKYNNNGKNTIQNYEQKQPIHLFEEIFNKRTSIIPIQVDITQNLKKQIIYKKRAFSQIDRTLLFNKSSINNDVLIIKSAKIEKQSQFKIKMQENQNTEKLLSLTQTIKKREQLQSYPRSPNKIKKSLYEPISAKDTQIFNYNPKKNNVEMKSSRENTNRFLLQELDYGPWNSIDTTSNL